MNKKLDGIGFGENVVHEILLNTTGARKNISRTSRKVMRVKLPLIVWLRLEPVRALPMRVPAPARKSVLNWRCASSSVFSDAANSRNSKPTGIFSTTYSSRDQNWHAPA